MNSKVFSLSLTLLFAFPLFLSLAISNAHAGWTCCTPSLDQCQGGNPFPCATNPSCDACGTTELKNPGTNGGVNECAAGRVSSVCDVTSNPTTQCNISVSPTKLTVKQGQSATFIARLTRPVAFLRFGSASTLIGISPSQITGAAANTSYVGRVLGENLGNATVAVRGISTGAGYEQTECSINLPVTVVKNDNPLSCTPGASCAVVGGGTITHGKSMSCGMPAVSASVLSNTNLRPADTQYQLRCDAMIGTASRPGFVTQTKVSGATSGTVKFDNFAVSSSNAGGSTYKCSFRYCLRFKDLTYNCSPWGTK